MTSNGDLESDLLDLTTMSLADLRATRSPELAAAVERELVARNAATDEIQSQNA